MSVGYSTCLVASAFIVLVLMLDLQRLINGSQRLIRDSQRLTHGSHWLTYYSHRLINGSIRLTAAQSFSRRVSQELVHGSQWLMYGSRRLTHGSLCGSWRLSHNSNLLTNGSQWLVTSVPVMAHSGSPMAQICLCSILNVVHH